LRKKKRDPKVSVEEDILRYFLRNPTGADTLEGIARWRLFDQSLYRSIEETNRAVNSLVSHGFLIKDTSFEFAKGVFRLDLKKREQAAQYLKRAGKTSSRRPKSGASPRSNGRRTSQS
jgi:hypothetical protein